MGFAAGFASGFQNSFNRARSEKADRENDMFRMKYADLIRRREQIDEYKKEDAKRVRKAQAMTEGMNLPDGAWKKVHAWLRDGLDDTEIEKRLKTGKFAATPNTPEIAGPAQDSASQASADAPAPEMAGDVDAQMGAAGLGDAHTPEQTAVATAPENQFPPAPKPPTSQTSLDVPAPGQPMVDRDRPAPSRMEARVNRRIAETAGIPEDEVQSILSGDSYQPEDIDDSGISFTASTPEPDFAGSWAEADFKQKHALAVGDQQAAAHYASQKKSHETWRMLDELAKNPSGGQVWMIQGKPKFVRPTENGLRLPDGQIYQPTEIDRPTSEEERKEWAGLHEKSKEVEAYRKSAGDLAGLYGLGGEIFEIVDKNPEALTATASAAESLTGLAREADAAISLIESSLQKGPQAAQAAKEQAKNLEKSITDRLLSKQVNNAAEARALLRAKLKLASYRVGALEGAGGSDTSMKELTRLDTMINNSSDPAVFKANLSDLINSYKTRLNVDEGMLNEYNNKINYLKETYGAAPFDEVVPNIDQFLDSIEDQKVQRGRQLVDGMAPEGELVRKEAEKTKAESDKTGMIPPSAIEFLKKNPNLVGAFEQKYGLKPGDGQKYLENIGAQ